VKLRVQDHIHLQGIGQCPAKPAEAFAVGERMRWNYDHHGTKVVEVKEASAHFLWFTMEDRAGKQFQRRIKRGRMIAIFPQATS